MQFTLSRSNSEFCREIYLVPSSSTDVRVSVQRRVDVLEVLARLRWPMRRISPSSSLAAPLVFRARNRPGACGVAHSAPVLVNGSASTHFAVAAYGLII